MQIRGKAAKLAFRETDEIVITSEARNLLLFAMRRIVVILSDERSEESKDPYSDPKVGPAIGMLRLAFAKPGEHSLSMTNMPRQKSRRIPAPLSNKNTLDPI